MYQVLKSEQLFFINLSMKNRLGRIKTTYDEDANCDKELFFREQQEVYKKQIQIAAKIDAYTEERFRMKPLQIGFMQSTVLNNQPKFIQIKNILTAYNKEVEMHNRGFVKGMHLKKQVMSCFLVFMRVMMLAPDTNAKKKILNVSYHWLHNNLNVAKRANRKQFKEQIKKIFQEQQLAPIDIINKALLYREVQEKTYHYWSKARTEHTELNAPEIYLQNYHTHKLEFFADKNEGNQNQGQTSWIETLKFPKVELPPSYYAEDQPEKNTNNPFKDPIEQQPQKIHLQAANEANKPDQELAQEIQQDLGFRDINEPNEGEPQELEQQNTKKGKLDPLLKNFILQRIRTKQKGQNRGQRRYEGRHNNINKTHKQQINNRAFMIQWAKQRSRLKTQLGRSIQGTNITQVNNKQFVSTGNNFLENDLDKLKVKETLSKHYKNISKIQAPADKLNTIQGLSLYDRRRVKTEFGHKPFSSILQEYNQQKEAERTLNEIKSIKDKFSNNNIYAPLDNLFKALSKPISKDPQHCAHNQKVVWQNSQLLSNPFIKIAKKKKKKKK